MRKYKRLPIKGIPNLRDLGGWPLPEGMTAYGVFLRSALPQCVSEEDIELLKDHGLTTVVDFRSEEECLKAPDALSNAEGIRYINASMFDAAAAGGALRIRTAEDFSWSGHYIRMAESKKAWMAKVITILAEAEGCTLYHCTTGKDRAGLISALLLSLCGAEKEDIAADYCVSQVYLRERYAAMERDKPLCGGDIDAPFYRTEPAAILAFLKHLEDNYGGAEGYLLDCGAEKGVIEAIRTKLTHKF